MKFKLDPAEIEAMKEAGIKIKEYQAEWEKEYCLNIGRGIEGDVKVKFFQENGESYLEIPNDVVENIKMNEDLVGFVEFIPYRGDKIEIKVF
ncbi:hypothetical protein [Candidatus Pyrohabitans sp.]